MDLRVVLFPTEAAIIGLSTWRLIKSRRVLKELKQPRLSVRYHADSEPYITHHLATPKFESYTMIFGLIVHMGACAEDPEILPKNWIVV